MNSSFENLDAEVSKMERVHILRLMGWKSNASFEQISMLLGSLIKATTMVKGHIMHSLHKKT